MAEAPIVRMRCTDSDLLALIELRRRYPLLNDSEILRWALHNFHRSPNPVVTEPPPSPRPGPKSRAARAAAMRAYLETLDVIEKGRRDGTQQPID